MSIATALRTELLNNSGIAAIVGARVYPVIMPQGYTLPAITYQRISGSRMHTLSGPNGRADARVQIDFYAEKYSEAENLADKVEDVLDGFKGTLGGTLAEVGGIHLVSDRDLSENNTEIYRISHDYDIFYCK